MAGGGVRGGGRAGRGGGKGPKRDKVLEVVEEVVEEVRAGGKGCKGGKGGGPSPKRQKTNILAPILAEAEVKAAQLQRLSSLTRIKEFILGDEDNTLSDDDIIGRILSINNIRYDGIEEARNSVIKTDQATKELKWKLIFLL